MIFDPRKIFRMLTVIILLSGGLIMAAHAEEDDDDHERRRRPFVSNDLWQTECGSCHLAFPPRMLSAESWQAVMSGLDKHFGSDASLDAPSAREIGAFLDKHARKKRRRKNDRPTLRITETRWFMHEHDEISNRVWKNPKVKSAANCAACQINAETGSYRESNI